MSSSKQSFLEDEIDQKFDRCVTDGVLKFGGGLLLGTVFSLLFFKRRRWPLILGSGFGLGMAYSNCEADINDTLAASAEYLPKATEKCP